MRRVVTLLLLWLAAVLLFVVGDTATTVAGLRLGAVELHPVGRPVVRRSGVAGILAAKAAVVVVCGSASAYAAVANRPTTAMAAPAVLVAFGAFATAANSLVIWSLL